MPVSWRDGHSCAFSFEVAESYSSGEYFEVHCAHATSNTRLLKGLMAELNGDQRPREQPAADEITEGLSALLTSVERAA
jgi:hypothetical protein